MAQRCANDQARYGEDLIAEYPDDFFPTRINLKGGFQIPEPAPIPESAESAKSAQDQKD
jgi:hypothetical protein